LAEAELSWTSIGLVGNIVTFCSCFVSEGAKENFVNSATKIAITGTIKRILEAI
jgi:hypothetical protein